MIGVGNGDEGQPGVAPGVESAGQGPGAITPPAEELRHTGAGGLVRSGAEGDDLAFSGQLGQSPLQLIGGNPQGARQRPAILVDLGRLPHVQKRQRLGAIQPPLERLEIDPGVVVGRDDRERRDRRIGPQRGDLAGVAGRQHPLEIREQHGVFDLARLQH